MHAAADAFGLWPDKRRKRSYVNQVLARAAVSSTYQPARTLWVRSSSGHYLPNPALQLRTPDAWTPVYTVMALDWVDRGCGDGELYRPKPLELVARLDAASVDPAVVEREKNVLRDKNAGKPANVLDKIVESGLKTYFKEVCLIDQPFIHDPAKTIAQVVSEASKAAGAPVALKGFVRYALGEGIEKQESDFAAEVAAAAGGQA